LSEVLRYRLDDLRRLSTSLASAVGLAPARSAALGTQLLWFDAAGASTFGIRTLPDWLQRLESREFAMVAEGRITGERAGTAVLDGQNGVPPLLLARAGELAVEKARDAGIGLVRLTNIGPTGPAAFIVAEMALGPIVGLAIGPGRRAAVALSSDEGLPTVYDDRLGGDEASSAIGDLAPWTAAIVPEGGWLVAALSVTALEPLAAFQERVGRIATQAPGGPIAAASLSPRAWESSRREARERGIAVTDDAWTRLQAWADRLAVSMPAPADASR
jgi:LDH2 family malate/lactate/ureidoglycolate dehydrogenase